MSRFCITPRAPFGSLLKSGAEPGRKRKPAEASQSRDAKHLAAVRRLPCLSCDIDPAGVAAHLRMSLPGKPNPGVGRKPDDCDTVPLCPHCHTDGPAAQHNVGEANFWEGLKLDPYSIAKSLYAVSPDVPKMRDVIHKAKEARR